MSEPAPLPASPSPSAVRFRRVKELFHQALDLEPRVRGAWLDRECGDDREMAAEVRELLASHEEAESFLEEPAAAFLAEEWTAEKEARALELPGARIGPYEIEGELGQGGMGTVYLAHAAGDGGEGRRVAIKLMPAALASGFLLERFRTERKILAGLDHPNIARLLEAGTSPAGSPFFVMEYVEGEPLDLYCQRRNLSTTKRLRLFRQICAAVQHAHQNLIVHRDLKPGNILVTAEGVPKLLDFGIAKLLSPEPVERPAEATATILRVMTPEYASPEQVKGEPITVASDVYSLGVLLYQVLTGRRPYRLPPRQPHEAARIICEQAPPRPSAVVGWAEEIDATETVPLPFSRSKEPSLLRPSRTERLRRRLQGDLDTVVMQALRKEPERRYGSVEQLSEDIRRHLEGLPISAHPETLPYLAIKFLRRNRGRLTVLALVVLALSIGLALSAREAKEAERRLAQIQAQTRAMVREIDEELAKLPGSAPVRNLLAQRAQKILGAPRTPPPRPAPAAKTAAR